MRGTAWVASLLLVGGSVSPASATSASARAATCMGLPATVLGGNGPDVLRGTPEADVIVGFGGDDRISSRGGRDRICAGPGDDVVDAGPGDPAEFERHGDTVSGGPGDDRISGGAGRDFLRGDGGRDRIHGGGAADRLQGGAGPDRIDARAGDDVVAGGGGADALAGGAGLDVSTFADASGPVSVDLSDGSSTGAAGRDRLTAIEGVVGSSSGDVLEAGPSPALLKGSGGDDRISGGQRFDALFGGDGDDSITSGGGSGNVVFGGPGGDGLRGGPGADSLYGGDGNDVIEGKGGDDTLGAGPGNDTVSGGRGRLDFLSFTVSERGVRVDLGAGAASGEGTDSLTSIEAVDGSPFDDVLTGTDRGNLLAGGPGDDEIRGMRGFDGILGGDGDDAIYGGGGAFDVVHFFEASDGIDATLAGGTATGEGEDVLAGIESIDGSSFDDRLVGDGRSNQLAGNQGDDSLDGGGGEDFVVFSFSAGPVQADLAAGSSTGDGSDTLVSIEGLFGSFFDDVLEGDATDNVLFGSFGDDLLDGRDGVDALFGDPGNDTCLNGEDTVDCESVTSSRMMRSRRAPSGRERITWSRAALQSRGGSG